MKKITKLLAISGVLPIFATPAIVSCENKKDKEIKQLQEQLKELKEKLSKLTQNSESLTKEKENLTKQIKELENKLNSLFPGRKEAAQILKLRDELDQERKENKLDNLVYPTKEESKKIVELLDKYIKKIDAIDKSKLNSDGLSWLNGIKYDWEIEKGNHESGLRYLLSNFHWGPSGTYVANSFYRNIVLRKNQGKKS